MREHTKLDSPILVDPAVINRGSRLSFSILAETETRAWAIRNVSELKPDRSLVNLYLRSPSIGIHWGQQKRARADAWPSSWRH